MNDVDPTHPHTNAPVATNDAIAALVRSIERSGMRVVGAYFAGRSRPDDTEPSFADPSRETERASTGPVASDAPTPTMPVNRPDKRGVSDMPPV